MVWQATRLESRSRRARRSHLSYLVTGAAGFIGSHVVEALLSRGDRVVGVDNFDPYYDPSNKKRNLEEIRASDHGAPFDFREGDIRDAEFVGELFEEGFEAVLHLAAMAGVRASIERPDVYYSVNLEGTRSLLDAARRMDSMPNFVFASTSSVYGATDRFPFEESDPSDRPLVPYSASKRAAEMLGHVFHNLYDLDFTALRFFTVYGPRNRPDMMAFKLVDGIRRGRSTPLYNGGEMYRDWTFIDDTTSGVIAAADRRLGYEIVNLGRGDSVRLGDFVAEVERLTGAEAEVVDAPMPSGDVPRTHASIDKARRLLAYSPRVELQEGVSRLVEWYDRTNG